MSLTCCVIIIQAISILCLWLLDLTKSGSASLSWFNLLVYPSPKDDQVGDLEIIKLPKRVSLFSRTHPHLFDVIYNIKEKL